MKSLLENFVVRWLLVRAEEPSTWSGTSTLAVAMLLLHTPGPLETAILTFGAALGGLLSIVLPEKK